jgi:hypothetical protein
MLLLEFIPTFLVFFNGGARAKLVGGRTPKEFEKEMNSLIQNPASPRKRTN